MSTTRVSGDVAWRYWQGSYGAQSTGPTQRYCTDITVILEDGEVIRHPKHWPTQRYSTSIT